jgi:hypothetical protein
MELAYAVYKANARTTEPLGLQSVERWHRERWGEERYRLMLRRRLID